MDAAGTPSGLTAQHFQAAAAAWVAHDRQQVGDVELRPLLGPGGAHFHLSGVPELVGKFGVDR